MAIKLEMLRCFATVARAGNLSDAASQLGRTQSAVSMTLKQLEDHLGQRLFASDRKNQLTALGEQVLELARSELRQFDDTIRAIEASAKTPKGVVRLMSVPSVAGLVFPAVVHAFGPAGEGMRIELSDGDSQRVIDALGRGQIDVGIASVGYQLNGIRREALFSDRLGLVCSVNHPLAHRKVPPAIADVISARFVWNELCQSIASSAIREALESAAISARTILSLLALIRTQNCVTILPRSVVQVSPGDLVFREMDEVPDRREVSLLTRDTAHVLPHVQELLSVIGRIDWPAMLNAESALASDQRGRGDASTIASIAT